ncbi:unnamed protein product [Arabis nemorensis]|uniref:Helicase C-terminal domain-containing protein n=1 Tax=Arabis nemorensis TaxID=586526 RepID=A0A565CX10_9BRAS|nr:unnamed protein product [Arabis nemorensis]
MTNYQKDFQERLVNKTLEEHLAENATGGWKGKLNNLCIQLKKNCNHPDLLEGPLSGSLTYPPVEKIVEQCGKFRLLERLLVRLFAKNHRVLIFSQWTKLLDIMDYYFSEKGFEVCRIDGSVKLDERRRQVGFSCSYAAFAFEQYSYQMITTRSFSLMIQIDDFSDEKSNCKIFLLSTRAGGLGINLTAADTCILYDSDWNPQMDLQAMDRCHRIGQTKPVHVYRLATAQSIECRILKRAFSKLKLEHVVIGKGQFHQARVMSSEPLEDEEDVLALLNEVDTAEDKLIQTDISDEDLDHLLDRSDLTITKPGDKEVGEAFPVKGPGWEVVVPNSAGGMLSSLDS